MSFDPITMAVCKGSGGGNSGGNAGYVHLDVPFALLNDVFQSGVVYDLPAETVAALDDAYDNRKPLWVVIDPGEFAAFEGQYIASFVQTSAYTHSNETQAGCFTISFMGQYIHFVDRDANGNKVWTVVGGGGVE